MADLLKQLDFLKDLRDLLPTLPDFLQHLWERMGSLQFWLEALKFFFLILAILQCAYSVFSITLNSSQTFQTFPIKFMRMLTD